MRVLISGASGMIGSALAKALTMEGHDVLTLVRPQSSRTGISWHPGVALEDHSDLEGLDAVVHLAGAGIADRRWTAARKKLLWQSRVESTAHLRQALEERTTPPKRFLCASAIGWYGHRDNEILDESSSPGHGFLANLCAAWESAAQSSTMTTACLRFGLVLDRSGGALKKMLPPFNLDSVALWVKGATGKLIGLDDAVSHLTSLYRPHGMCVGCTMWSLPIQFDNGILRPPSGKHWGAWPFCQHRTGPSNCCLATWPKRHCSRRPA